jgi:hypothetical protein
MPTTPSLLLENAKDMLQWELIEMGYEDGKDPKSRYQHSRMSTYPNNSVRCHFEDDLEIFLTNSMV